MSLQLPSRLLMGAGPSPVPQRVLDALARNTIGHLDPAFTHVMDECAELLRPVFGSSNPATFPISGTGSGGMDALVANFVREGDRVVCGIHGLFGLRMADALGRAGAEVVRVESDAWGRAIPLERLIDAISTGVDACVVVHAETSTGVRQPLDGLADACAAVDALLLLDCVTSLGGMPVELDAHGVDAAFSGTQKCLNCPPGLAPFSAGPRALTRLAEREKPVRSWYFDLSLVLGYWLGEGGRAYHHTAPINMVYALHEALEIVHEEGLEARTERHRVAHQALRGAFEQLGAQRLAPDGEELPSLLAVHVPDGVEDEAAVRGALLADHDIEISGGLGPLAGRVWRIGVMGEGARPAPQERLLRALCDVLRTASDEPLAALADGWQTTVR